MTRPVALKVGALARQTGISVRTLHYYDEIGLLRPSRRTEAGHRLYDAGDIARLQQIRSLQQLGFSLEQVRACLDDAGFAPARVIGLHVGQVRAQIARLDDLCCRLESIARGLAARETVSVEEFLQTLEVMSMVEKYYTPEQLQQLEARRQQVGEERIRQVEAEWPELMAAVQAEMDAGTDPASERVQQLARRWQGLIAEFTGGDPGIARSLRTMWQQETEIHGLNAAAMRPMGDYIGRALAAGAAGEEAPGGQQ